MSELNESGKDSLPEPPQDSHPHGPSHPHHPHFAAVEELLSNTEAGERRRRSLFHKIVNYIIAVTVFFFVAFLVLFAFTQTSTFREIVRRELVAAVNPLLKGKLSIGRIDGTFFTNLSLRDAVLTDLTGDTILSVSSLRVRVKPLQLFLSTIYVKNLHIDGANARLIKDSSGTFNIAKVFPASEDTSATDFAYRIKLDYVGLHSANVMVCNENMVKSTGKVPAFSLNNFRAANLEMSFESEFLIKEKDFSLTLSNLAFETNISGFNVREISGIFHIDTRSASVRDLKLTTSRSDMLLTANIEDMNFFGGGLVEQLGTAPMKATLLASPFHFDDLSAFVHATSILKGPVTGEISASGSLTALFAEKIDLKYENTELKITGALQNILEGADMKIRAVSTDSRIVLADVSKLLPMVKMPLFEGYESVKFDSLFYEGTPLNFDSRVQCSTGGGTLSAQAKLNFIPDDAEYSMNVQTSNLDLKPFTVYPTAFNGRVKIEGKSFNLRRMNTSFDIDGDYSVIGNQVYQGLALTGNLREMTLGAGLKMRSSRDSLLLDLQGKMVDDTIPAYTLLINSYDLDLGPPLQDSSLKSELNFSLSLRGRGFDFNTLKGESSLRVGKSRIFNKPVDSLNAQLRVDGKFNNYKEILFTSDICDLDLRGVFSIGDFGSLVKTEFDSLKHTISEKISRVLPKLARRIDESVAPVSLTKLKTDDAAIPRIDASFLLKMKDVARINTFLEGYEMAVEGKLRGNLKFEKSVFSLECLADVPFFKFSGEDNIVFCREAKLQFAMGHPRGLYGFNDLNFSAGLTMQQLYVNTDMKEIECGVALQSGVISVAARAGVNDKISAEIKTIIDAQHDTLKMELEKLRVKYNQFELANKGAAHFAYRDGNLSIRDFELWRNDSRVALNGFFSETGEQNLRLSIDRFKGYDLTYNFLSIPEIDVIDYDLFMDAKINGTLASPRFTVDLRADSMSYKKKFIGSFVSRTSYAGRQLSTETKFLEAGGDADRTRLAISGSIPIDLSAGPVKERLISTDALNVSLRANSFNIGAFGDVIPSLSHLRGYLNAEVSLKGTYGNPSQRGFLQLRDGGFKLDYNNLEYGAGLYVTLNERTLSADTILLYNAGKTKNRGTVRGHGELVFLPDNQISLFAKMNGDLVVLSKDSKNAGDVISGDLFITTDGDITYSQRDGKKMLKAGIIVKEGDLVFSPKQTGFRSVSDNFFYRYPPQNISLSVREAEIRKMLEAGEKRKAAAGEKKSAISGLDYEIQVRLQNDAAFVFMLSPETNQKLNANLNGELFFEQKSGIQNFQGELKVLEGSTLEFIKTFSATGTLRFEADVTNPNLDITGVYKAYYTENDSAAAANLKEEEVAVKLKIQGPLNDLTKNFTKNDDNLAVYYGKTNIEKNTPSTEYDKADAIWFIIMGKFKRDLTQQDRTSAAGQLDPLTGTATSLASSFVGSILNTYVGDAVKSIEIRNLGANTKFNLSGRFKKIRYTLGGSTNFLQDISSANVRVEYPLFENLLLRVERKEANTQANYQNEMMNELGLRYRFQF